MTGFLIGNLIILKSTPCLPKVAKNSLIMGGGGLEAKLSLCLREFIKNPKFSYIDYESEIKKDTICNERTPLNKIQGTQNKLAYLKAYKRHAKGFLDKLKARIYIGFVKSKYGLFYFTKTLNKITNTT